MSEAQKLSNHGPNRLADLLAKQGVLTEPWLRDAFAKVRRHEFLPDRVWLDDDNADGGYAVLERAADPDRWFQAAYGDEAVVTQLDDGGPQRLDSYWATPTSSASMPSTVAQMLTAISLPAEPEARRRAKVMEIGAATGYNAALMAELVGPRNVTTIEIDPALAAGARKALDASGYEEVSVVTGDGELGHAHNAPYDRVLSTASVLTIPRPWVEQTTNGGLIVSPFETAFHPTGMVCLTVRDDTATGRFSLPLQFMRVRGQRTPARFEALFTDESWEARRTKPLDSDTAFLGDPAAQFAVGLMLPGVQHGRRGEGRWLSSDDSWAYVNDENIFQWGPRDLFDEANAAADRWREQGRPDMSRYGLTVTPAAQHVWLDDENNVIGTVPAAARAQS
ncbi:methyltransferase domain-containing protein [Streptomyces cinnamoneus]|uniref:methyltransferase domain-containing protein n=1 Tax=Streptomyces cinnamoneus TaxID=53446 RepID=UPI0033E5CA82